MARHAAVIISLIGCNTWVRPVPPHAESRDPTRQEAAAVRVHVHCDTPSEFGRFRNGSGVMVTDWQVLTARHVVDCPSIPVIHVYNSHGDRWKFTVETEWLISVAGWRDGVTRIQMASGDTLSPHVRPPTVRDIDAEMLRTYEPVYIYPGGRREIVTVGETMALYGGGSYGGYAVSYDASTEAGYSGSGGYDLSGNLLVVHLGELTNGYKFGALVTRDMVPQ